MTGGHGGQILTFGGVWMDPFAPRPQDIRIEDVAHALSLVCRAGGHLRHFYSVAQHLVNCRAEAAARGFCPAVQLGCLLHDASECYIADVTRPVKGRLTGYRAAEQALEEAIRQALGPRPLTGAERRQLQLVDDALLYHEFWRLRGVKMAPQAPPLLGALDFSRRPPEEVEAQFLEEYARLRAQEGEDADGPGKNQRHADA